MPPSADAQAAAERIRAANGYIGGTAVDEHTGIWIDQQLFGWEIIRGGLDAGGGVSDRWTYDTGQAATKAWYLWAVLYFANEPDGWVRHRPSDRRRAYDDHGRLAREWTAP